MASSISLFVPLPSSLLSRSEPGPRSLRFCGLRREALGFRPLVSAGSARIRTSSSSRHAVRKAISAAAPDNGSAAANGKFDYDLVIIEAGVGGHGAALHAVEKGLKTVVIEGDVIRGCVPSKALLAVSGRMRELQSEHHMKALGLQVSSAGYDRTLPWSLLIRDDSTKFCELLLAEVENFEVGQCC